MVFFIRYGGEISRTEPLRSYDEAIGAARRGPSGASFSISFFSDNWENDRIVLEGFVF